MSDSTKGQVELILGTEAELELEVAPVIVFVPKRNELCIREIETANVPVGGVCENLFERIDCQLDWTIQWDVDSKKGKAAAQPGNYSRSDVELLPDAGGKTFTVVDRGKTTLHLSAFEAQMAGRGKLGYTIRPKLFGAPPVTVSPSESGLSFALPARVIASSSSPKIGTRLDLSMEMAEAFRDCSVTLSVTSGSGAEASAVERTWQPSEHVAGEKKAWWVGRAVDEATAAGPPQLAYRATGATIRFKAQITITEPPATGSGGKGGKSAPPRTITLPPQDLVEVPTPNLESFDIALAQTDSWFPAFVVQGSLVGFDDELDLRLDVDLFAYQGSGKAPRPFWEFAHDPSLTGAVCLPAPSRPADLVFTDMPATAFWVHDGKFAETIFELGVLGVFTVQTMKEDGVQAFAVLSWPADAVAGTSGKKPIFAAVVSYAAAAPAAGTTAQPQKDEGGSSIAGTQETASDPALEPGKHGDTFAPFHNGSFSWPAAGTGVCSDLLSLKGESTELEFDPVIMTGWTNGFWKRIEEQNTYNEHIFAFAQEFRVDPLILKSLIAQESEYNPNASRPTGSYAGLTQVSKDVAKAVGCTTFGAPKGKDDRFEPAIAIRAGAKWLSAVRKSLDSRLGEAFTRLPIDERYRFYAAGYNLGPGTVLSAVEKLKRKGRPLTWLDLVDVHELDVTQKKRPLSPDSPLGKAIVDKGWTSKLDQMRHYAEDIVARARQ